MRVVGEEGASGGRRAAGRNENYVMDGYKQNDVMSIA